MSRNIYTILLTVPMLFSACNSTTKAVPQKEKIAQNVEVIETATVKSKPTSKTTSVTYVNDKKDIQSLGEANIESFMVTLKAPLKQLIQIDKSYKSAMGGCSSIAMSRTDEYNAISETKIRRTALKYRNPKNKPDETDTIVMERFLANNAKKSLVVEMPNSYRVYKPLYIKPQCLACHGENISPELQKIIKRTYPKDMATGFKLGEFRGVVVAKVKK